MTARGTAARVARLRRELGERDIAVLDSLRRVRLLTTDHVRRLHFTDNSPSTQARRCRALLRRLAERRIVVRLGRSLGGVRAGSSSALYGLTGLGLAVLGASSDQRRRRTIWEAKPYFQDHLLAVSELYVQLVERARAGAMDLLGFDAEPACWRRFAGIGGEPIALKPDASVRVGVADYELTSFVEVDLGTESVPTIRRKCQVYLRYWRAGLEQQRHGVFPRVVWLVPDQHRVDRITEAIKPLARHGAEGLFTVTTAEHGPEQLSMLPTPSGDAS